ncbi:hypothetical protein HYFRA_00013051, partial [Hymenoscyphus fraxineus]
MINSCIYRWGVRTFYEEMKTNLKQGSSSCCDLAKHKRFSFLCSSISGKSEPNLALFSRKYSLNTPSISSQIL